MSAHPVVWFEVMGKKGPKVREFYGDLFGWTYDVPEGMDYGLVEAKGGQGIPGGIGGNPERQWVTFYVSTPSIEASLKQAESLGGKTLMKRTVLPGGTIVGMLADPEGQAIGLVEDEAAA